jgi:hypothetical protein
MIKHSEFFEKEALKLIEKGKVAPSKVLSSDKAKYNIAEQIERLQLLSIYAYDMEQKYSKE